jgi:hypothetical protein
MKTVEELAREAGFGDYACQATWLFKRFRDLVLEEAAKVCDSVDNFSNPMTANDCAEAIRAMKGQK